jgi:hypothetical protein
MTASDVVPIVPTNTRVSRPTVALAYAAGAALLITPPLVEFVSGDFFLLLPVALLLTVAALPGLCRLPDGEPTGPWGSRLLFTGLGVASTAVVLGEVTSASTVPMLAAAAGAAAAMAGLVLLTVGLVRTRRYPLTAIVMFAPGLLLALATESFEQSLSGTVPWLADLLPPLLFACAGAGLLWIAASASHRSG